MDRAEVVAGLHAFFESEFPSPGVTLTEDTDLIADWFVDSFAIVQTVMFIEREFDIQVSRADINGENFKSIATLASFVSRRLSG